MATGHPAEPHTMIDAQHMADLTADFFLQASHDEHLGDRLSLADTTVHIHFTDTVGVTLRLDRQPVEAEPRIEGQAEVELWGTPDNFVRYARGEKHLAMGIMRGEVEYAGPVRKFLRIMPILRSFDGSLWKDVGEASQESSAGTNDPTR